MTKDRLSAIAERWQKGIIEALDWSPRYRYGGEDPREGLDCSGLVSYVLGRAGYPGGQRRTADWYKDNVFKATSPETTELGGYAEQFSAFVWPATGEASHIALRFSPALCVEANRSISRGDIPPYINSFNANEDVKLFIESDWYGPALLGANQAVDDTFWDLAYLWMRLANSYQMLGLNSSDISPMVFTKLNALPLARDSQDIFDILGGFYVTWPALKFLFAALLGRNPRLIDHEAYFLSAETQASSATITMVREHPLDFPIHYAYLALHRVDGLTQYRFDELWHLLQPRLQKSISIKDFDTGVRVRDTYDFSSNSSFVKRYIPSSILGTFLVNTPEDGSGTYPSVPTRRV